MGHPSSSGSGADRDAVMEVVLDGGWGLVHVTGQATTRSSPEIGFYLYKGSANWNSPLWSGYPGNSFDLIVKYQPGDSLFFATNALWDDSYDGADWRNVQLTGIVPEPLTLWMGLGFGAVAWRARRQLLAPAGR